MSLRRTALLGLIFAVMLSLTLWDRLREETASMETYAERDLLGVPQADITGFLLDNQHGRFRLERRDGVWWLTSPIETRADPIVDIVLSNLANAKRHSAVEGVPDEDLSDFGLADPIIQATLDTEEGETITLQIGDSAPALNRHFATVAGSGDVFTVSGHVVGNLDKSIDLLRDRRLFPDLDLQRSVTGIAVSSEGGAVRIAPGEEGTLRIVGHEPFRADLGLVLELLRGLERLQVRSFAADQPGPGMGLEPPLLSLTLFSASEEIAGLDVGTPTSRLAEEFYAMPHGRDEVVTLSNADVSLIPRTWADWIERDLMRLQPEEVVSFTLAMPVNASGTVLSFARDEEGPWRSTINPDQRVDQAAVEELLGLIGRLESEGVAAIDPDDLEELGLTTPWVVFTWSGPADEDGNRTVERLDHGNSAGTSQAYFRRNGEPVVHMAPSILRDVLELRSQLFDRRLVTVNLGLTAEIVVAIGGEATSIRWVEDHWERADIRGETQRVPLSAVDTALSTLPALEYDSIISGRPADLIRSRLLEQAPWRVTLMDEEGQVLVDLRTTEIPSLGNRDEAVFVLLDEQRVCEVEDRGALISLESAMRSLITR